MLQTLTKMPAQMATKNPAKPQKEEARPGTASHSTACSLSEARSS